jgi:hypothetical protein
MENTSFKEHKSRLETSAGKIISGLIEYFMLHANAVETIAEEELLSIKELMSYNFWLMIFDPQSDHTDYVEFFESILDYVESHAVPLDVEKLKERWNALFEIYRELYDLLISKWQEAIEADGLVEKQIRAVDMQDPNADPSYVKEKKELLRIDVAVSNSEMNEVETEVLLNEITDITHVGSFRTSLRDDRKGTNISPQTVYEMLHGKIFPKGCDRALIVDARFPFEYHDGHITTAINIWNYKKALSFFKPSVMNDYSTTVFVFHCEFSSSRGPGLSSCMIDLARKLTRSVYGETDTERKYKWEMEKYEAEEKGSKVVPWEDVPKINYFPHVYIMTGGYKGFFETYPTLCTPRCYLPEKTICKKNQDAYCGSVQPRSNQRPGEKGKTVPVFMTNEEYADWITAWKMDRVSTATMTESERPFLVFSENEEEMAEEEKNPTFEKEGGEEEIPKLIFPSNTTTTTTTTTTTPNVEPKREKTKKRTGTEKEKTKEENNEEEEEEEEEEYEIFYKGSGKGRKRGGGNGEESNGGPSKRGRK